jgi:hypothetical protein
MSPLALAVTAVCAAAPILVCPVIERGRADDRRTGVVLQVSDRIWFGALSCDHVMFESA